MKMKMKILVFTCFATIISGCGTTVISSNISNISGMEYGVTQQGYPTIEKIIFNISSSNVEDANTCIMMNIDLPEGGVVEKNTKLTVSGVSSFSKPAGLGTDLFRYRYTLQAETATGTYTFDRLYYTSSAGVRGGPVMASKYWSPELLYTDIKKIVANIDTCLN